MLYGFSFADGDRENHDSALLASKIHGSCICSRRMVITVGGGSPDIICFLVVLALHWVTRVALQIKCVFLVVLGQIDLRIWYFSIGADGMRNTSVCIRGSSCSRWLFNFTKCYFALHSS